MTEYGPPKQTAPKDQNVSLSLEHLYKIHIPFLKMLLMAKPHSSTWSYKEQHERFLGNEMNGQEQYYNIVLSCDTHTGPGTEPVVTGHTV